LHQSSIQLRTISSGETHRTVVGRQSSGQPRARNNCTLRYHRGQRHHPGRRNRCAYEEPKSHDLCSPTACPKSFIALGGWDKHAALLAALVLVAYARSGSARCLSHRCDLHDGLPMGSATVTDAT
jgi:hypothetical protein